MAQRGDPAARPVSVEPPRGRAALRLTVEPSRIAVDPATLTGLAAAFVLIGGAMLLSGSLRSFVDVPSLLMVGGGTIAVTLVSFSFAEFAGAGAIAGSAIVHVNRQPRRAAERVLEIAELARTHGVLALDSVLAQISREPFLRRALGLVVDGHPAAEVDRIMTREIEATRYRHDRGAGILRKAAEVAPAMGLIGTLVGLVQMLAHLDDPSRIGPAMALALLTTFYGAVLAYMVFSPLAAKLERNAANEAIVNQIYLAGALSVARQENPRLLAALLNTLLPPSERLDDFE